MTIKLTDAAEYLGLHPRTLQERAKLGMIPGASKPGKRWVFRQAGLDAYLDSFSPCRSTASQAYGISTSHRKEAEFVAALALPIRKRRSSTTSA